MIHLSDVTQSFVTFGIKHVGPILPRKGLSSAIVIMMRILAVAQRVGGGDSRNDELSWEKAHQIVELMQY